MSAFLKFKNRNKCPYTNTLLTPGGIVLDEMDCVLPINHQGVHRAKNGAIWDNWAKRIENHERAAEPANRPRIFLGR